MAGDDYTPAVGGGLKLKGVNMSSKISKHKKKKKKPKPDHPESTTYATPKDETSALIDEDAKAENESEAHAKGEDEVARSDEEAPTPSRVGKTEAELRHEERRRKRLDERLERGGTKTHKERVEELNRYLSNLSEHHDMPRIGPG